METIEAVSVSLAQNPLHFGAEAEVRRRLIAGVHLEILRDRLDALAQACEQRRVGRLGRQYPARQQHDAMASRHGRQSIFVMYAPTNSAVCWSTGPSRRPAWSS